MSPGLGGPLGRSSRAALAVGVLILAAVGLTGCSSLEPIGVSLRDGKPAVEIIVCGRIESVTLTDNTANVLWRVRAAPTVEGTEFVIGGVPPGFVTEVAYRGTIQPDDLLIAQVVVAGDRTPVSARFRTQDLVKDEVWSNGRLYSSDEFVRDIGHPCGPSVASTLEPIIVACLAVVAAMVASVMLPYRAFRAWQRRSLSHGRR